jgi:20S proteasome subunit alpha 6
MSDTIETWSNRSSSGTPDERERFRKMYMSEPESVLEIVLRHIRGERAPPASSPRTAFSGPLLTALEQSTLPSGQHTHATLVVLATAQLALEYAEKADGERGRAEAYRRLSDIAQHLPAPHIHRSLDLMFRDWKMSKKGSSGR